MTRHISILSVALLTPAATPEPDATEAPPAPEPTPEPVAYVAPDWPVFDAPDQTDMGFSPSGPPNRAQRRALARRRR